MSTGLVYVHDIVINCIVFTYNSLHALKYHDSVIDALTTISIHEVSQNVQERSIFRSLIIALLYYIYLGEVQRLNYFIVCDRYAKSY